jgi:hypothetical protein
MRENLVKQVQVLQKRVKLFDKKSEGRRIIGLQISDLNKRINAIRPKRKTPDLSKYIVDIVREGMTTAEFQVLYKRACARMEEANNHCKGTTK